MKYIFKIYVAQFSICVRYQSSIIFCIFWQLSSGISTNFCILRLYLSENILYNFNKTLKNFDKPTAETEEKYNAQKSAIERECKNLPVQGLCADMLKIAMGNLFLILEPGGVKLVNCVHDELVFECKAEEADEVAAIVKTEMEKAGALFLKDIPCIAEVKISDTWEK